MILALFTRLWPVEESEGLLERPIYCQKFGKLHMDSRDLGHKLQRSARHACWYSVGLYFSGNSSYPLPQESTHPQSDSDKCHAVLLLLANSIVQAFVLTVHSFGTNIAPSRLTLPHLARSSPPLHHHLILISVPAMLNQRLFLYLFELRTSHFCGR